MQNKNKAIAFLAIFLILALSGVVINQQMQLNAGEEYIKELQERVDGSESLDTEPGATVYWFVQREGSSTFALYHVEHNVITNAGRVALTGHIGDTAIAVFDYIEIGEGSGGDASSVTLVTPFDRQQGTYAYVASYNFTITYIWTAGAFSGEVITEAGVFNAAAGVTLLSYQDFSGITLQSGDSLQVQFMFQVGS